MEENYRCNDVDTVTKNIKNAAEQIAELLILGYQLELSLSRSGFKVYKMKKSHHTLNFKENNEEV